MRNIVQILLLCAVLPTFAAPRGEETLEERKKRIMRKYVRETGTITQSEEFVPSDLPPEDARVAESEKFGEVGSAFEAEDRMSMGAPSPRPRPVPRATNNNWLLGDAEEADPASNPYDDLMNPFAEPSATEERSDYWSSRRGGATGRTDSRFGQGGDGRYSSGGFTDLRMRGNPADQQGSIYGRTGSFGDTRSPYTSPFSGGLGATDGRGTYGASPETGLLGAPVTPTDTSTGGATTERPTYGFGSPQGYQPYKSPYEVQREQRAQQWSETLRRNEQETPYQKPNPYQQWKERNQGWDPTGDDAYLREGMPSGSRR